jgi:hypothetical protein
LGKKDGKPRGNSLKKQKRLQIPRQKIKKNSVHPLDNKKSAINYFLLFNFVKRCGISAAYSFFDSFASPITGRERSTHYGKV